MHYLIMQKIISYTARYSAFALQHNVRKDAVTSLPVNNMKLKLTYAHIIRNSYSNMEDQGQAQDLSFMLFNAAKLYK